MRFQIPLKPGMILVFLSIIIVANAFSIFFFSSIDRIVNVDLYNYHLTPNPDWINPYQEYSQLLNILLASSMLMAGLSAASVLVYARNHGKTSKSLGYLFPIVAAVATGFSVFFFKLLDNIVNIDLYLYGLQFSFDWADRYWTYARLISGLQELAIVMATLSGVIVYISARPPSQISKTKVAFAGLSSLGAISLISSIYYDSQILALIGLGLIFWGVIVAYVTTEEYVKKPLLEASTLPTLIASNEMLNKLNYKGNAVYLPPRYLTNIDNSVAHIPRRENPELPSPNPVGQKRQTFIPDPEGIMIIPPGDGLAKLFEKHLGISFTKVDLRFFRENLPRLLTIDFEIADKVQVEVERNFIRIMITGGVYGELCKETMKLSSTSRSLGCPISSALACILAKVTGKPISISRNQMSEDGKILGFEYAMLDELGESAK